MLDRQSTTLIVIDVQGTLAESMHEKDALFDQLRRLILGSRALELPILCTEQVPDRLGPTLPEIREVLTGVEPIRKQTFSCCGCADFSQALEELGRPQLLLAGIETHICVFQTAAELTEAGYDVEIVTDAVSSRTDANKQIGLEKCRDAGARMTSVETALFELQRTAEGDSFKTIIGLVK